MVRDDDHTVWRRTWVYRVNVLRFKMGFPAPNGIFVGTFLYSAVVEMGHWKSHFKSDDVSGVALVLILRVRRGQFQKQNDAQESVKQVPNRNQK